MAVVSARAAVSPEQVYAVMRDGWSYSNWVVGTSHVRAVEAARPAVGSRVFHATGVWPAVRRDDTIVEQVKPCCRLVLLARVRPFGEARMDITLTPDGRGCRIEMSETPTAGPAGWFNNPVLEFAMAKRNIQCLARLCALAERRTRPHWHPGLVAVSYGPARRPRALDTTTFVL